MEKMSFIEEKKSFLEKILAKTHSDQLTRNLFLELGNGWVVKGMAFPCSTGSFCHFSLVQKRGENHHVIASDKELKFDLEDDSTRLKLLNDALNSILCDFQIIKEAENKLIELGYPRISSGIFLGRNTVVFSINDIENGELEVSVSICNLIMNENSTTIDHEHPTLLYYVYGVNMCDIIGKIEKELTDNFGHDYFLSLPGEIRDLVLSTNEARYVKLRTV